MSTFGSNVGKNMDDDPRVLHVKLDKQKQQLETAEKKLNIQNNEFQILRTMYIDHLNAYEAS